MFRAVSLEPWILFAKSSILIHSSPSPTLRRARDCREPGTFVCGASIPDTELEFAIASSNAFFHVSKSFWLVALRCQISAPESIDICRVAAFAPIAARDSGTAPLRASVFRLW